MRNLPDLSFVAPERREEVIRRINAIEDFLQTRGRKSAEAHARELGLRTAQFYNLVRAWKEYRRPERLAGAERRRQKSLDVSNEQAAKMNEIIAADPRAAPADMVREIVTVGQLEGWELPRREIVTRYVTRTRPSLLPTAIKGASELLIDHTVLEIPVLNGDALVRPLATILIDTQIEAAIGLSLSLGFVGEGDIAAALLDGLRHGQRHSRAAVDKPPRIAVPKSGMQTCVSLLDVLGQAGFAVRTEKKLPGQIGKAIEALFGQRRAGIELRPRLVLANPEGRAVKTPIALQPMSLSQAFTYARPRLIGLRTTALFAHLDDVARAHLDAELDQMEVD